ncbi:hypothetical protein BaRGS_00002792 [Batillaria attramentaria]|uniref:Stathmin n=1 Tax=Batillaria attramentaria TaxID=370345 RepID=A0ABD0M3B2_9CAEN
MASAGDGDTTSHPNKTDQAVSFEICFDRDNKRPRSAPPKRLSTHKKKAITKEEIDKKQQEAEERRKENEREMIDRIAQKREECRKLNENFQALLAQDAKLHGGMGTTDVPSLPREELVHKFRAVKRDYCKIATAISKTVSHQTVPVSSSKQ